MVDDLDRWDWLYHDRRLIRLLPVWRMQLLLCLIRSHNLLSLYRLIFTLLLDWGGWVMLCKLVSLQWSSLDRILHLTRLGSRILLISRRWVHSSLLLGLYCGLRLLIFCLGNLPGSWPSRCRFALPLGLLLIFFRFISLRFPSLLWSSCHLDPTSSWCILWFLIIIVILLA